MKTILCFGDSNTFGYDPSNRGRYAKSERWPGILQEMLGADYDVIEEGLNGRTTAFDDPIEGDKNGKKHLPVILESHEPIDLVILMLGTNDLKTRFHLSSNDIMLAQGALVDMIQAANPNTQVLLLAPPPMNKKIAAELQDMLGTDLSRSFELAERYSRLAEQKGIYFFNTGEVVEVSELDGVHLSIDSHRILAAKLAELVR